MKFLHRNTTETSRWETYKTLELIPDAVPNPYQQKPTFTFGLDQAWRILITVLTQELVYYEQQISYLERCLAASEFEAEKKPSSNSLQKLWMLMD
jgi:hypothetical protein